MHYIAKNPNFCASRIVKYLSICFLLAALLTAGCDDDDDGTSYSQDTNPYGDNGDNGDIAHTPVPGAVILGAIGLTFSGWLLRRRKML
jgi:hypothetical protein